MLREKYASLGGPEGWEHFLREEQGEEVAGAAGGTAVAVALESGSALQTEQAMADYLFSAGNAAFDPGRSGALPCCPTKEVACRWIRQGLMASLWSCLGLMASLWSCLQVRGGVPGHGRPAEPLLDRDRAHE